jgi:RNA recognition motif-containing protein
VKKLYIGNLPFQAGENEVQEFFSNAGFAVSTVTLIRDRQTGDPRGFGFVEIANDEEAERAIQALNGQELLGRRLVVNEARPPRERGFGGGGRGGGGGGYGRGGGGGRGRGGGRGGYGGGGRDRY